MQDTDYAHDSAATATQDLLIETSEPVTDAEIWTAYRREARSNGHRPSANCAMCRPKFEEFVVPEGSRLLTRKEATEAIAVVDHPHSSFKLDPSLAKLVWAGRLVAILTEETGVVTLRAFDA